MAQPDNGPAAPAAPRVLAMRRSKPGQAGMDRLKGYLREIPVIHQQLVAVIRALEATAGALRTTTDSVQRLVKQWEEEQRHGQPPGEPAAAPAAAVPAGAGAASAAPAAAPAPVQGGGAPAGAGAVPAGKDAGGLGA